MALSLPAQTRRGLERWNGGTLERWGVVYLEDVTEALLGAARMRRVSACV